MHIADDIAHIIKYIYESNSDWIKGYCEPFCGMCSVYKRIPFMLNAPLSYRAGDINKSLVMMWQAAQHKKYPSASKCTKKRYYELKNTQKPNASSAERGFIGHLFGFRNIYFQGFGDATQSRIIKSINNVKETAYVLQDVHFSSGEYTQFSNLKNYIIYCDPPYAGGNQNYYREDGHAVPRFDSDAFWRWCVSMSRHNIMLVSEYSKPRHIKASCLRLQKNSKECLYMIM